MRIDSFEKNILIECRLFFKNPKLKIEDIMEWSTSEIQPQEHEIMIKLPLNNIFVAIKKTNDKRCDFHG